ncbi:hydroxymethylglutaryl-CoA lyase [Spirosoma sp. KCTC 42546]|uniref:hydroxymethylglutaryl-CoA lyase n=1 Tax=Spirosoma sp. KCTC 42546 TaxID=2520506 RepID=UPI001159DE8C|nr:hydroxymethylglutaryl-CoA lyase [Spirosoma sp. KCTC 42546]QDK78830.1 hydroxymethylglutaryl-CoA lyase [Spirosoma sp. KCTC 42546]
MKLIECPRDAMQGLDHFVPTDLKIQYLNTLLQVGFDTLDFGSFVSPKAIPQLRDTAEVLAGLTLSKTKTKLLAIVANLRGAEQAVLYPQIQYVGFPLSISETFQQRNTNKSIAQALVEVVNIQKLCLSTGKQLVVYLSMGFGNPYGDPYSPELVVEFTEQLVQLGITIIAPSDTVGSSTPEAIEVLFRELIQAFPKVEFGAHLHARPGEADAKVRAVVRAGIQRIDGALRGFGGCPMAADDLTGNLPTEEIIQTLASEGITLSINQAALQKSLMLAAGVF